MPRFSPDEGSGSPEEAESQPVPHKAVHILLEWIRSEIRTTITTPQKNAVLRQICEGVFKVSPNMKGLVLNQSILKEFDLEKSYGINPSPLFNLNQVDENFISIVEEYFQLGLDDLFMQADKFFEQIDAINEKKMLGRNTAGKLAFIHNISNKALRDLRRDEDEKIQVTASYIADLRQTAIELLERQLQRLGKSEHSTEISRMAAMLRRQDIQYQLIMLAKTCPAYGMTSYDFCLKYADEIAQILGPYLQHSEPEKASSFRFRSGKGIEALYVTKDKNFITLGDRYGDCTASEVRDQVDPEIANIHWTVYPWLLDPYYRVIEVTVDGKGVLKGHIMPLIIDDQIVLSIDALETVPRLRKTLKGKENPYLSKRLFEKRTEILGAMFHLAEEIAERMNIDTIYVDRFSNAEWLR